MTPIGSNHLLLLGANVFKLSGGSVSQYEAYSVKLRLLVRVILALSMTTAISGCGSDQVNRAALGKFQSSPPRPDSASPRELEAGLKAMEGRVLRKVDAYNEIVPTATFRYFMHPAMEKDAALEFNVSSLSSLTLSPRISDLQGDCSSDPEAGEVEVSYALDDAAPTRFSVDRDFDKLLAVDVQGSNRLMIVVNQGNGTTTCDWFGLGFLNVRER